MSFVMMIVTIKGYKQDEEAEYISDFASMEARSYSEILPSQLNSCRNVNSISTENFVTLASNNIFTSVQVSSICSSTDTCIIPETSTLNIDGFLNVGALVIKGSLVVTTSASLCAGYVSVEDSGTFIVRVPDSSNHVYIYIKNNGLEKFGTRRFIRGSGSSTIIIEGAELKRTWSLLSETALQGSNTIKLMHDPTLMGWKSGDRIVIAPMLPRSTGTADACNIVSIVSNSLTLDCSLNHERSFSSNYDGKSKSMGILSAEVIHMTRNVVITGDDLTIESCQGLQDVNAGVTKCTYGLHTMSTGTSIQVSYSRIEKCGQRGILAKYCLHMHLMQDCETCLFRGNAIEHGHQRAVVVHGTHLSTVEFNVVNDVRGAAFYIEDGNELYNKFFYNVAICPWPTSSLGGCSVPGTSNNQADTDVNQAGIWSISQLQHLVGNRMVNHFNGMFWDAGAFAGACTGDARNLQCCTNHLKLGHFEGNTFHGNGRFGTYFLGTNTPKKLDVSIASNGAVVDTLKCDGFNVDGTDNGKSVTFFAHTDYGNAFVGTYMQGDVQYAHQFSSDNNNGTTFSLLSSLSVSLLFLTSRISHLSRAILEMDKELC